MRIKRLVEDDLDFYPIVGRLALDREVVSGVLAPIFNEPGKVWWVALEGDAVLGLVASVPSKTGVDIKSLFVRNGCRGRGVGRRLFDACMKWCEKHYTGSITSVVSPAAMRLYVSHGFEPGRTRGRFTTMVKDIG